MKAIFSILFIGIFSTLAFSHKGEKHGDAEHEQTDTALQAADSTVIATDTAATAPQHASSDVTASFSDFPTLHPLIVHFPIVFLLLAPLFHIISLFVAKGDLLKIVALLCVTVGFAGAWLAGNPVHPHTDGLPEKAARVLELHEKYAGNTIILSAIAMLLSAGGWLLRKKMWLQLIIAAAMLAPAYTVSRAGHYGAQLVHLEGVGVQGKFLEEHHKH